MSAVKPRSAGRPRRKVAAGAEPAATVESVTARLLALPQPGGPVPVALWTKAELGRALSRAEKPHLDAALARLQEDRRLLMLGHGESVFFAFAEPLREWLGTGVAMTEAAGDLPDVYRRLVRESGGFSDVKISALARALGPGVAVGLAERLKALWRMGDATLSLGDWSLASEETRAAAVELDGEKYLLVRLEG